MSIKIIVASDSFKGSLSSREVGEAAARGIIAALPHAEVTVIPIADGGEGTVEAVVSGLGGEIVSATVSGPLGDPVSAQYGICGDTAVIEMASASGLPLIPERKRNPMLASSFGTGELILHALQHGCRDFLIGLGGSATNDAGIGMLSALGFQFLDKDGRRIRGCGGEAGRITSIDFSDVITELKMAKFTIACDVNNPLTGPNGASMVFGPQKGADDEMAAKLDENLSSFARTCAKILNTDHSSFPGAGAAGGMGFAFLSFLNAKLQSGIEMVMDSVNFDSMLENASLVITGEGRIDNQTCMGKAPGGILKRCKAHGIPVVAIGGSVEPDALPSLMEAGFTAIHGVTPPGMPLSEAIKPEIASRNVEKTVSKRIKQWLGIE
ncbi:MAG: glycerate kinase [Muribaculaceae bacterium]|nr:glycerate kinase [Muribaculaceae bacterium]